MEEKVPRQIHLDQINRKLGEKRRVARLELMMEAGDAAVTVPE
jgi:hypothetical protein